MNRLTLEEFKRRTAGLLENTDPFVVFSKPGSATVFLLSGSEEEFDPESRDQSGYLIQPFDPEQAPGRIFGKLECTQWEGPKVSESEYSGFSSPEARADYEALIADALLELRSGRMEKVVISRSIPVRVKLSQLELLEQVLNAYPEAYRFFLRSRRWGTWIGATPELLCRKQGDQLETYSLAGTRQRSERLGDEPLWTQKEIDEQEKVTRYICDRFEGLGLTPEMSIRRNVAAGNLWHLLTRIRVRIPEEIRTWEAVRRLHPTSAVCGMPREAALDFIRNREAHDRNLYAGFHGEYGLTLSDTMELYVNLRCAKLNGPDAQLYVGAGITEGSDPSLEFEETEAKGFAMGRFMKGLESHD